MARSTRLSAVRNTLRRPGLKSIVTIIPWPKYVQSIADLGIWDRIVRRYADTGSAEVVRQCDRCFAELVKLEREEVSRAITGENYETIWGKPGVAEVTSNLLDDESEDDFEEDDEIIEDFFDEED